MLGFMFIRLSFRRQVKLYPIRYLNTHDETTHFGFEKVLPSEKERKVYEVFENVAEKYDVMNDAMSGGIHRLWKDYFINRLAPTHGTQLLDVAGGTGDIAFRFLQYLRHESNTNTEKAGHKYNFNIQKTIGMFTNIDSKSEADLDTEDEVDLHVQKSPSHVTVCDINQAMLDVGKKRAEEQGFVNGISWLRGNAECLPVADQTYDAYTIAYGIRNCTHIDVVLQEAYRVLKPGGRFMCLEFSQVSNPFLGRLYDEYSFQVIPVMGQVIAADWKSYQYLVESIRNFPSQEEFAGMVTAAGFRAVTFENLLFGVSAIHSGFKL